MAENEILDLGGRRWQRTRAALAKSDLSFMAIAECVADNLQSELQLQLSKAFRKGQTLLAIFEAVDDPAAMRAAVSLFQYQQLARIAREAAMAATTKDVEGVAQCAADMLVDGLIKKALVLANHNGRFQETGKLKELQAALDNEFAGRRSGLAKIIEASLHGQRVRQLRRPTLKPDHIRTTVDSLLRTSLVIPKGKENHASRPR